MRTPPPSPVQGFPTIKLLYVDDSSGSIKSVDYNGGRAAKDLVNWALDKVGCTAGWLARCTVCYMLDPGLVYTQPPVIPVPATCVSVSRLLAKHAPSGSCPQARNLALKRIGEKPSGGSSGGSAGGDSGSCGGGGGARGGSGGAGGDSFYSGTDVVTLTSSNFDSEVVRSNELWLVEFYAPWCVARVGRWCWGHECGGRARGVALCARVLLQDKTGS